MSFLNQIQRLVYYGSELGRICDEVSQELDENRRRRSEWFQFTRSWKRAWLAGDPAAPYPIEPEMRAQISVRLRHQNLAGGESGPTGDRT